MRLRRLRSMGLMELAYRGRQEASKWLDRVRTISPHPSLSPAGEEDNGEGAAAGHGLSACAKRKKVCRDRLQEAVLGRFFAGAMSEQMPTLFAERMPGAYDQILATAEAVCRRRFDLLGYRGLTFGDRVDWRLDPISGRRSPLVHWSLLNPLDAAAVGDSKVVWELNRHQWLVHLGQAYQLTGDERYAELFAGYVRDWVRANPRGMGINWASSLEVALRLISWCWGLFLLRGAEALSPEFFAFIRGGIRAHASHVEKYLSYYFSPNTHLTGEALGLFYAGVVCPEQRGARRWRELGARILVEQSERQILPDGVYFEQSTCYQRYSVEIYLHFLILAERHKIAMPTAVREQVQQMLDFLLAIRWPDGTMPQIGDADGGWLLPLATRAPDDYRGIFSTAAAFFGRSDYAWAAEGPAPETLWLLGPEGLQAFQGLCPAPAARAPSALFADGGYVVMRSGWQPDSHQLIFDVGPLGCPVSGGHGHADLLSVQCAVFGEPYLVDPGTHCYTADPAWRDFFRSSAAHSTVTVDSVGQAVAAGPFGWEGRPRARVRQWLSTEAFDLADAEHDAYGHLPDPVVHRRRVLFVKPRYWVVVDDLKGAAEHRVELRFQFAPMAVTVDGTRWARAQSPGGRGLLMRAFATVPLTAAVCQGELAPLQGWVSPAYGQRQPAPVLIYTAVTRLPLRIVTLLVPAAHPSVHPPTVFPRFGEGPGPVGLVFGDGGETVVFGEREITLEHK